MKSVLSLVFIAIYGVTCQNQVLLESARKLIGSGQISEALEQLNDILRQDDKDYMAYYYRGMALMASGKTMMAVSDYERALSIKHDFEPVLVHLVKLYVKLGQYDDVKKQGISDLVNSEIQAAVNEAEKLSGLFKSAKAYFASSKYAESVKMLDQVVESSSFFAEALELRAKCYLKLKNLNKATFDYERLCTVVPDSLDCHFSVSKIYFGLGDEEKGMQHLQKCLHSDQDYKPCKTIYSKMKGLRIIFKKVEPTATTVFLKEKRQFLEEARSSDPLFHSEDLPDIFTFHENRIDKCLCHAYVKEKKGIDAITSCKKAMSLLPDDLELVVKLAEGYQLEKDFEQAVTVLEDALKSNEGSSILSEALRTAKQKLAKSKQVDYYEVLGVSRNASKDEIRKAHKKLAVKWHPDRNPDNQELAGKKMTEINDAYEILSDDEKKRQFDAGIDPNNPHAGAGGFSQEDLFRFFQQQRGPRSGRPNSNFKFHFDF